MSSNSIPERLVEWARSCRVSRLSVLPIAAVVGMVLAQIGVYISVLMYVVRAQTGNPLPRALIFAPDTGAALAALALPPLILLIRSHAGEPLSRRIAACLPLAALFAAFIAVSLPGNTAWEYGTIQTFIAAAGRRGILECGMIMLLFVVIPKRKRGFWYGSTLSAGFLWWRWEQARVRGMGSLADTVSWYNSLYGTQIVMYCAMAAIIVLGFAKRPVPENVPEEPPATPENRKKMRQLIGALFLFYLANGFMPPRVFPAWMNGSGSWDFWQMHVLIILACPLYGLILDRARDGAKELMTICSVFLMLAPTLNALSDSPTVYSIILCMGALAQFAMMMTVILAVGEYGKSLAWAGRAYCLHMVFRSVSLHAFGMLRGMPELDGGISTLLATMAALAFFAAARRWDSGAAAGSSAAGNQDADVPAGKYTLEQLIAHPSLSAREREVAALWLKGMGNKQVAMALYISENTVKTHIRNILSKLGAPNRTELLLRIIDFSPEK